MPTKKKVSQKQKQKQSVVVNVNVAKAKARSKSSAKKSRGYGGGGGGGGGAGGSVSVQMPPQIYASPLDKLTPAMYGSQGQQIQQRSMEELLKNFLSNQEKQQTNTGFKSLGGESQLRSTSEFIPYDDSSNKSFRSLGGESQLRSTSEFIPYDDSSDKSFRSLGSLSSLPGSSSLSYKPPSLNSLGSWSNINSDSSLDSNSLLDSLKSKTASTSIYSRIPSSSGSFTFSDDVSEISRPIPDDISELTDPSYMSINSDDYARQRLEYFRDKIFKETGVMPIPFQNEERTYLKASEPDYEKNVPKFSQNEAQVSQKNIYESSRRPQKRPPVKVELDEESISYKGTPATRASGTPASKVNIIPFEDEMSSDSLSNYSTDSLNTNPFPKNIYNKMMGLNVIPFDEQMSVDSLNTNPFPKNMYNKMMGFS